MCYLLASHWLAASSLGEPLHCWAGHPVIVPSSEEGGLRGLRVCFAFCVRPVVTKGRFPLVTVELAPARTDPGSSGTAGLGTLWGSHTQEDTWVLAAQCCLYYAPILPLVMKTHKLFSWPLSKALAWNIPELWILWQY